jgi:hypothetical protein
MRRDSAAQHVQGSAEFDRSRLEREEIPLFVAEELSKSPLHGKVGAGARVAITCGRRGIANIDLITKSIVDYVRSLGARPFVVPSMGSPGGATAEGQTALLAGYGVTRPTSAAP